MVRDPGMTRRWMLGGLAATAAAPVWAEAPSQSPRPPARPGPAVSSTSSAARVSDGDGAARIVDTARLTGTVGFVVAETQSGRVLESFHPDLAQPPASVAKTMTAFYALDRLGPDHRFATQVLATGPVSGGRLAGDLVLVGSGDPSLDTDRLGDLATTLAARGIREITGRYLAFAGGVPHVDEIDAEQPDYVGYNPGLSGLNLNYNRVYFEWARTSAGYRTSLDARGKRFAPPVAMTSVTPVDRDRPLFAYAQGDGRDLWTVSTKALGARGSRWLPVRHSEDYCAGVFATLMAAQGLRLPPVRLIGTRPDGAVLAETRSDALTDVLREMLKYSTNLTAEAVGLASSGQGSLMASGQAMTDWAAARYAIASRFTDHSGLAGDSRIAASQLVRTLRAARGTALPEIMKDYAMRDGTGNPVKSPVKICAKTGTLNFVSSLAGYIQPPSGTELTFAIFCADTKRRDGLPMAERERPAGSRAWIGRARAMQGRLISRWAGLYT